MAEKLTIGIDADISSFSQQMSTLKQEYLSTKKEIDENKIDAPMAQNDVTQSFGYMLSSVRDTESVFKSIQDLAASLPQGVQEAMSSLVQGMRSSITSLTSYVKLAGSEAGKEFNKTGFNNSIRFSAANLMQYTKDLKAASEIVTQMSEATRQIYSQNHREISSVVNPAISKMFTKHHTELPDKELAAELLNNKSSYGHIAKLLESYGLTDAKAQRQVVEAAIKTSTQRINRLDVQRAFAHAGIAQQDRPIFATDVVRDTYKKAYINGGRYINEQVTPLNTKRASKSERHNFYENIKNEILHGNSVAFKAAQDTGLVTLSEGKYRFAKERFVKDSMLDQFGGYVVRERKRAAQGSPQYHKNIANPYDATALINKDGRRIREADRLIEIDTRPNANPYYRDSYKKLENDKYENPLVGDYENPELTIPELINIPRMTVRKQNGRQLLTVKRRDNNTGNTVYQPNIDYSWQKTGILENPYDEFITMGRNPILDRLIERHKAEGARFDDRSFGYGFDEKDNAAGGLPLVISMDLNEFRDKDKWNKIKFSKTVDKNGKSVRETFFPKDATELINGLYRGDIEPELLTTDKDGKQSYVPYRAFAGKTTGGGTMMFMPSADYKGMINEDKARGIMPMLQYFSEMQNGKDLINPATGKPFENNEEGLGGYARFYDARNKILSHSIPIKELGGRTPTSALVNLAAFYDAYYGKNEAENMRFDGGGFIAPDIYSKDFQARMGPAKFLAQRFNWRKWLIDANFATKGGEYDNDNNYHFFMPGLSATDEDYKTYREAIKNNVGLNDVSEKYGGKTFKEWRDSLFVDVMNPKFGAMLDATTIKAPGFKKGRISEEQYDQLVKTLASSKPNSSFSQANKVLDQNTIGQSDKSPMVKLTPAQQTELMSMMSDDRYGLGLRLMKDTENYVGKKQFWSPAYMSSVMMTPAMMQRSADNYLKAFREMSTDEGIIKRMFSGNDIDSRRVQNNNSLIHTDRNLKYKIAAEKSNLVTKQLLGYGYFPEESGMSSQMMVAGVNPYSLFNVLGYDLTGHNAEGNAAMLKTGKHGVIAATVGKDGIVNWTRSPYAPGANFFGSPVKRKAIKDYGLTNDSALFNIEDFYELNTGDFDGDFVWANTALKDDKEFKERTERRNKKVVELANKRLEERKALLKSQGKTNEEIDADALKFAGITDRAFNASSGPTGLGYKIGQAFRMGLFTEKDLAEIDDYANDTYQKGIDMAKKVDVRLAATTPAVQEAIKTRKPIERLTKELQETFNGEGTIGSVDLFKYGLPTYVDQLGTNILSSSKAISGMDVQALDFIKEQIEQNNEARYADATPEEQNLAKWYGNLVSGKLTGQFQLTSTDTLAQGRSRLQKLQAKIAEFESKGMDKETIDRMKEMEREAVSVLNTESTIGFTENNKDVIAEFYRKMNWTNPVTNNNYNTESEAAAAAILYEQRRQEENSRAAAIQQSELDKVIKEQTGKTVTDKTRENLMDRITAAHMFTGFNWSNAKYFTEGSMTIPSTRKLQLSGKKPQYVTKIKPDPILDPSKTKTQYVEEGTALVEDENGNLAAVKTSDNFSPVTISFDKDRQYNQAQVARQVLTGTRLANPKLEAHALIGSAAHAFMDTYGRARAFKGDNDRVATQEEALEQATNALKDYLLGEVKDGKRVLSKEQKQAQVSAGVSFSDDGYGGIAVSGKNADEIKSKLEQINKGSLKQVANLYYERALQNMGEHMIMSEGTSFGLDQEGNIIQEEALGKEGHNGIFIVPTRNDKNVIGFQRFRKDEKTGKIEAVDAGTYFTPDMIKQDANGAITIADWKSSESGQNDALFQTAYYAHNLEELGKKYYLTGNEDYKNFARYVNYDKDTGRFTSNIKYLEAIDLFGNKNDAVLQANYNMELGDAIAQWVEKGMQNEAKAAQLGFIKQLPQEIQPLFNRSIQGNRPVLAPGANEKEYSSIKTKDIEQLINEDVTGTYKQLYEISQGGTGIKDAKGEYIDQDKAFLVEKYKEDRETLNNVRSFSSKERMRLNNLDYKQRDRYTQNIEDLRNVFTPEDYEILQKYYQGNHGGDVAADVALMDSHFTAQQQEAKHQMEELFKLRLQYYNKMPEEMQTDYGRIAFGQGTSISKLRTGVKKRQQDLSVLDEVYKTDDFYDETLGYIPTDAQDIFRTIYKDPERGANESKKAYNQRRKELRDQKLKEAQEASKGMAERQKEYDDRRGLIDKSFTEFERDILQNITEEKEHETFAYDLLKGQNVKASIFGLKEKAAAYKDLEKTRLSENGSFAYTDNARTIFTKEALRLEQQAEALEKISSDPQLSALLESQGAYSKEKLDAMIKGKPINQATIKNKRMLDFALEYAKTNPDKSVNDVLSAVKDYGKTYDEQIAQQQIRQDLAAERSTNQYNQMMRQESLAQWGRYGLDVSRTKLGRGIASYYGSQANAENRLSKYHGLISEKQAEQKTLDVTTEKGKARYDELQTEISGLSSAAAKAEGELGGLGKAMSVGNAVAGQMAQSFGRLSSMFGRRIFMKLINDVKQFTVQFNKTMTEIQMITLKSDDQMSNLGSGLIDKAKELKISIQEISQSAATLYRQGLSDKEVNERLDVISKFSKVSGAKVADATKLITVAMNTGLVTDPQVASDIVTALGDNAATNAQQIEKGIEKAGAAAAADGTTFAQLASMLTAITSTTQIGGNVAGRTLNTIFGRMNKIGTNELLIDENGNMISGSAVAKLLGAQGINQYDAKGNKRSSYDVLYELSQKWEGMTDAEQQQIANAIAGTRQYSNFAAIMQGMSEGKVDEYMKLAGESAGITDKKYDIYTKSLEASMTELKDTWQSVIADLVDQGYVQEFVGGLTQMIQGIGNLVKSIGTIKPALPVILTLVGALSGAKLGLVGMLLGAGAGIASYGILSGLGHEEETATEKYNNYSKLYSDTNAKRTEEISRFKVLADKNNRTTEENNEFVQLAKNIGSYTNTSKDVEKLVSSIENLGGAAEDASVDVKTLSDKIATDAEEEERKRKDQGFYQDISANSGSLGTFFETAEKYVDNKAEEQIIDTIDVERALENFNKEHHTNYNLSNDSKNGLFAALHEASKYGSGSVQGQELISSVAELFENVGKDHRFSIKEDDPNYNFYRDKNKKFWGLQLSKKDMYTGARRGGPELINTMIAEMFKVVGATNNKDTSLQSVVLDSYKQGFTDILSKSPNRSFSDDLIPFIADVLVQDMLKEFTDENGKFINPDEIKLMDFLQKEFQSDNQEITVAEAADQLASRAKGYQKTKQQELVEAGLPSVKSSGYYIDLDKKPGEQGYLVSQEEALKRQKEYEKSFVPTAKSDFVNKPRNNIYFGDNLFGSYELGTSAEKETVDNYHNALEKIKETQNYLKQVSEDTSSAFQSLSIEEKETFALNEIQKVFNQLGLEYTGSIGDFLTTSAESMFSESTEYFTEKTKTTYTRNPKAKPNLKAVESNSFIQSLTGYEDGKNGWYDKNKSGIMADQIVKLLRSGHFSSMTDFMHYVNTNAVANLAWNVVGANQDVSRLIRPEYFNENNEWIGPSNDKDTLDQLLTIVMGNSLSYGARQFTTQQKAGFARKALTGIKNGLYLSEQAKTLAQDNAWNEYIEPYNEQLKKIKESTKDEKVQEDLIKTLDEEFITDKDEYLATRKDLDKGIVTPDEQKYLQEILGTNLYSRSMSGKPLQHLERKYIEDKIAAGERGYSDVTQEDKIGYLHSILNMSDQDIYFMWQRNPELLKQMAGGFSDIEEYADLHAKDSHRTTKEEKRYRVLRKQLEDLERSETLKYNLNGEKNASQIQSNVDTIYTGNAAERMALINQWRTSGSDFAEAQYAIQHNKLSGSASIIAAALGTDEKSVNKMLKSTEGKEELTKALNAKVAEAYKTMAISVGANNLIGMDFSTGDLSSLKDALQNSLDLVKDEYKDYVQSLINSIDENGELIANRKDSFGEMFDSALKDLNGNNAATMRWMRENWEDIETEANSIDEITGEKVGIQEAINRVYEADESENKPEYTDIFSGNPLLTAVTNLASLYPELLDSGAIRDFYQDERTGGEKDSDYYSGLTSILSSIPDFGQLFAGEMLNTELSPEQISSIGEEWIKAQEAGTGLVQVVQALEAVFPGLIELLNKMSNIDSSKGLDIIKEGMRGINSEATEKRVKEMVKWRDSADNAAKAAANLMKGGYARQKQLFDMTQAGEKYSDMVTAAQNSKGKTGKQVVKDKRAVELFGEIGIDETKLKAASKETIEKYSEMLEEAANEQGTIDIAAPLVESLRSSIEAAAANGDPIVLSDFIQFVTSANGDIDYSSLIAFCEQHQLDVAELLKSYEGIIGSLHMQVTPDGEHGITVADIASTIKGGGRSGGRGGYRTPAKSSGGGGGGKSAADKLLETLNYRVKESQHEVNMAEIEATYRSNMGDTTNYLSAINAQIKAQHNLGATLKANINAMYAQLRVTAKGTEDWNKLVEAIHSAEEQLSAVKNTLYELSTKKIQAVELKYEISNRPTNHALAMYQKYAERYQTEGDFTNYQKAKKKEIKQYDSAIADNESQIAEWKKMLKSGDFKGNTIEDIKKKILDLTEQNADLANQKIIEQIELNKAKVANIGERLAHSQAPLDHQLNILSTYGNIYQSLKDYDKYRKTLLTQNDDLRENVGLYQQAREEALKLMNSFEENSAEWYEARDAVYSYDEALAQATASIEENTQAAESALVQQLATDYERVSEPIQHQIKMSELMADKLDKNNDFEGYQAEIQKMADATAISLANETKNLAELQKLLLSGKIREGTPAWDELNEKIRQAQENIVSTETSYEDLVRKAQQSKLEHVAEVFSNEDAERQHRIKMIQYQETRYQNAGQLTNYGAALAIEKSLKEEELIFQEAYAQQLKETLEQTDKNSDAYEKYVQEFYKAEEAAKNTKNEIDALTKKQEENALAILKIRKTVEDTVNQEIKSRIQKEKNMLSATVQIENQIANIIKKRYTDELNLMRKRDEKAKESLNNEKNLLTERLDAKKKAIDYANKYEELAEYKKQLAILEMDTTRTKEAKELRRKVEDLQQSLSLQEETDRVAARNEEIDEEIRAMDQEATSREERMNEWLSDYKNIADQIEEVLNEGESGYFRTMQEDDEWKKASEEQRRLLEQGWHDTWLKMRGEIETYWDEVAMHMESKDDFIDYMMQSDKYTQEGSETDRKILIRTWEKLYDDLTASEEVDEVYVHIDNIGSALEDQTAILSGKLDAIIDYIREQWDANTLADFTDYRVTSAGSTDLEQNVTTETFDYNPNTLIKELNKLAKIGEKLYDKKMKELEAAAKASTATYGSGSSGGGSGGSRTPSSPASNKAWHVSGVSQTFATRTAAQAYINGQVNYANSRAARDHVNAYSLYAEARAWKAKTISYYKHGGLADYTGLAWVDGSKQRPEAFLNPEDTQNIRALLDMFSYVRVTPPMTHVDSSKYGNNTSIGDINITINQAELKEDADYEDVARRVGNAFTKQLQKDGFNIARYAI